MSSATPNPYPVVYDAPSGALQYVFGTGQITIPEASINAITALTGDVTATGPGSVAATIAALAVTTGKIAAGAVTTAKIADNAITPGLISTTATDDFVFPRDVTASRNLIVDGTALNFYPTGGGSPVLNVGNASTSVTTLNIKTGAGHQALINFNANSDKWLLYLDGDGGLKIYDEVNGKVLSTWTPNIGLTVPAFKLSTSPTNGYVLTSDASGNGSWAPASGGGGTPNYVQFTTTTADLVTTSSSTFVDANFGVTITPSSNSAAIRISMPNIEMDPIGSDVVYYTIFRGIAGTNLGSTGGLATFNAVSGVSSSTGMEFVDVPGTTSPVTYELYVRTDSGGCTIRVNDEPTTMVAIAQEIH